ncbi:RNA polymerase sigma factor [Nitriliruptor alkaliphilus]|uniref:RNA polymerase sigma factor n=1 Tax=Nitriliruptor alkaliphilus TaxID=427918 RepID=UPI00069619DE|nr:sigma-70 family RNA polymerase sigma factor [Nitriliruptor alkaliphilus]
MHDPTPAPYGAVTRRWTALDDRARDGHAQRLLDVLVADAHIERPGRDQGLHYRRLVSAAVEGDQQAFAWLATSHRPLLLARGRALFRSDPAEWGSVCLELLHRTLCDTDTNGRWGRQQVAATLSRRLNKTVRDHLSRTRLERPLRETVAARFTVDERDPHLDLSADLAEALQQLDPATRDGLTALADRVHLAEIAARHDISHDALRQRLVRARAHLQPQLETYRRSA